jgi:UDP-N-acetylmuramyl-tripeptide synthetase
MAAMIQDAIERLRSRGIAVEGRAPDGLQVDGVTEVSTRCGEGSMFVAIRGARADGHAYLADAASRGARVALVCDPAAVAPEGMTLLRVEDTRRAAGPLAQFIAGDPSRAMDVIGVTGTNGKTTTTFLLEAIFKAAGRRAGLLGTVVQRWGERTVTPDETTPSAPALADRMREMAADGVDALAMEVSSHAIDQHRIDGIRFRAVGLTNVTQDHLDYHRTMEAYAEVKASLFKRMHEENPGAIGAVNLDDPTGARIARMLRPEHRLAYSVSDESADLLAESILFHDDGFQLRINFRGDRFRLDSPMHCYFNAINCMTATALALAAGIEIEPIRAAVAGFRGAPGRFELVEGLPGVRIVVDYAHTPDALTQVLLNARRFARGRLIAVFGCGGDRDRAKRPLMGRAAARLAHRSIVTNDNPRTEDPREIARQIVEGMPPELANDPSAVRVILDRRAAIRSAVEGAAPGDAIVIAGKGHEDYQIVGREKRHFDDREVAREAIAEFAGAPA